MSELKHLNLTERDFDLLVDGLEALPEKGMGGEMLADLLGALMFKEDGDAKNKMIAHREKKQKSKEQQNIVLKEDIKILQGKLLMLKRYLMQEGALKDSYEIINHIK